MIKVSISLFKTLATIFLGIFICLLLIELGLFIYGRQQTLNQARKNSGSAAEDFVILALGESTTAPIIDAKGQDFSWPSFLEETLNEADLGTKIKVVNEGMGGTNSTAIFDLLDQNLEKYQPDLVISMMGINDHGVVEYEAVADINQENFISNFRTYRLFKFLLANLRDKKQLAQENLKDEVSCDSREACLTKARFFEEDLKFELAKEAWLKVLDYEVENSEALIGLGNYYYEKGELNEANSYFSEALKIEPEKVEVLRKLGTTAVSLGKGKEALDYFQKGLEIEPRNGDLYVGVIQAVSAAGSGNRKEVERELKKIEQAMDFYDVQSAEAYAALADEIQFTLDQTNYQFFGVNDRLRLLEKAMALSPDDHRALLSLARYHVEHNHLEEAEKFYLRLLEDPKVGSLALIELFQIYQDQEGGLQLTEEFKKRFSDQDRYVYNYQKLYQKLRSKNIPLIAVQYPMRSTQSLELIFANKDGVWLVDNEVSFKAALAEEGSQALFLDKFAGDFGHCTARGNQLVADNIKKILIDNWQEIKQFD